MKGMLDFSCFGIWGRVWIDHLNMIEGGKTGEVTINKAPRLWAPEKSTEFSICKFTKLDLRIPRDRNWNVPNWLVSKFANAEFRWLFRGSQLRCFIYRNFSRFPSFNHVEVIDSYPASNPKAGKVEHSLHLHKRHPIHLPLGPSLISNSLLLVIQTFKALIANLNSLPVASRLILSKLERTSAFSSSVVTAVPRKKCCKVTRSIFQTAGLLCTHLR